jgi:large subunit ribosomal protein L18
MKKKSKKLYLQTKKRYLKKIIGTIERLRLSVFRSHKHIYAQLIDDTNRETLVSCSTLDSEVKKSIKKTATKDAALVVGKKIGEKALTKNLKYVVFDRGNKPYHGRIKSLAEGARIEGLIF